jgi:peptidoglycan L-alanyl-D-glutamate endopeptidase CwlK
MVNQGLRTTTQQAEYVAAGTSQTMNSRHLTGHAVDLIPLVDGQPTWEWDYYYPFAEYIKAMAQALCTEVDWGGDWTSLKDGPHWELTWAAYPLTSSAPADEVVEV